MNQHHKIGIGTVQFGLPYGISNTLGQTPESAVEEILKEAASKGVLYLDTASAYGKSEAVLGKNDLSAFRVISKFMPVNKGKGIRAQLENSLRLLNIPKLYGYLAHRPSELFLNPWQWTELQNLKKAGLTEKIGFSFSSEHEVETALKMKFIPDLVQLPFNYFDRRFAPYMKELKKRGCEIHTRSAFLQGLFFCKPDELHPFFEPVKPRLNKLQEMYSENLAAGLLTYCLSQDFIDCVVMGVNSPGQLRENFERLKNETKLENASDSDISQEILNPSNWPQA